MNDKLLFAKEKFALLERFLNNKRYEQNFYDFQMQLCTKKEFDNQALSPIKVGDRWGGYGNYGWLSMDVKLPNLFKQSNKLIVGYFDLGMTGGGNNSGFEGLCYVNDEIVQAVDENHREIMLGGDALNFNFKIALWAGLDGGGRERPLAMFHEIKEARFSLLNKAVDDLYYYVRAINQTLGQLTANDASYHHLIGLLDAMYNQLDLSGNNQPYEVAAHLVESLRAKLATMPKINEVIVHCVGHTHIDVAWLWRLQHTREKSLRSFSTVLRLMELYPNYIFLQSQPQLYQYIKEDAPEVYEKIKQRIKEGRWEANGAMWIEPDCNLTSGESLVRQLLYGKQFYQEEFGVSSNCLWLPDVFGYSSALPQILRKSDINTFMTTKISWSQYNRIPNDTFYWVGLDGSEILTHFITTPVSPDSSDWYYTYNGLMSAGSVQGIWQNYINKDINQELLLAYGYGDGGGGVNREMLEMIEKLDAMPTTPRLRTTRADRYFNQLHEQVKDKALNKWQGELYLEFHRGTYTSQAKTKWFNRRIEYLMRNAEWLLSLMIPASQYPIAQLLKQWQAILTNQFHDILPGSSIADVYTDALATYERVWQTMHTLLDEHIFSQVQHQLETWTIINPNNLTCNELIYIEAAKDLDFYDEHNQIIPSQASEQGYFLDIVAKPLATTKIVAKPQAKGASQELMARVDLAKGEIESCHYHLKWNATGQIVSLYDKDLKREVIKPNALANELRMYEDVPRIYDAWELEPYYRDKFETLTDLIDVKVVHHGALQVQLVMTWRYDRSTIEQHISLYAKDRRIDFITKVNWQQDHKILRVEFPLNLHTSKARFDTQFGNLERSTHNNTSWEFAQFEVVGHKWALMEQRDFGVALLNDSKYGYRAKEGVLSLSLLKSAKDPDYNADKGEHTFTYTLLPYAGDWFEAGVENIAQQLNNRLLVIAGELKLPRKLQLSGDSIILDALKCAEDGHGYIMRVHEFAGQCSSAQAVLTDMQGWHECNLMERNLTALSLEPLHFELKPYEVKSFRLILN